MRARVAAVGAVLLASIGASHAAEVMMDARRLLTYCDEAEKNQYESNTYRTGFCVAFIEASLRGWEAGALVRNAPLNYCFPRDLKLHDILRTVTAHLRANAHALGDRAELAVIAAVQKAYPCAPKR